MMQELVISHNFLHAEPPNKPCQLELVHLLLDLVILCLLVINIYVSL